ncbi:MAG: YhdP family protein [Pseudomonadota bacterium]
MNTGPDKAPTVAEAKLADTPRGPGKFRPFAWLFKKLSQLMFCLLILLTVYVTVGRIFMGVLTYQADTVAAQVSQAINMQVSIEALNGSWSWFSPTLEVRGLRVTAAQTAEPHTHSVARAELSLDPFKSLLARKAVITKITADHLDLTVQQNDNGGWTLAGLAAGQSDIARRLQNFVLNTGVVTLIESSLDVRPFNAPEIQLGALNLTLENTGSNHQLQVQVRINDQDSPSQFALTMEGEPGDDFNATAYANVTSLDLVSFVTRFLPANWNLQAARVSASVWADINQTGLQSLRGTFADVQVQAEENAGDHEIDLQNAAAKFQLRRDESNGANVDDWSVAVQNLTLDWQQAPWEVPAIQLHLPANAADELTLHASQLDLAMLAQIVESAVPMPERAADALRTLNPSGLMESVTITSARDGSYAGGFLLRSNLQNVAVDAWQGAPAGSGINGYLQADAKSGFVELDSNNFSIRLPQLFAQTWSYDHINARVGWQFDANNLRVQSSVIDLANASLKGRVQFELYNTRNTQNLWESDLSLLVGMLNMDAAVRAAYLPTLPNLREPMTWLEGALQAGQLSNNGFILRTSTIKGAPAAAKTTASWYNIENGQLKFLPQWPALEGITGHVEAREADVDVMTTKGRISGINLQPTTATVRPVATGGSLVTVIGAAATDTATGLEFLRTTPLHDNIGSFLDNWQSFGNLAIGLNLAIPLGINSDPDRIDVSVQSTGSELVMPDYDLVINDINGEITYNNLAGLNATALTARLFNAPLEASITTIGEDAEHRGTRVSGAGRVNMTALQLWPRQSEFVRQLLEFMPGAFEYSADLTIPSASSTNAGATRLELKSDLVGVTNLLPAPMSKSADESANVELSLGFGAEQETLSIRYGDFLSGEIVLDNNGIQRGQLYLGERNRNFTIRQSDANVPGLLVNGDVATFNFEEWKTVADSFSTGDQDSRALSDYLRLVDVNAEKLQIFGQELTDINVQVRHENEAWLIYAQNTLVEGNFVLPDNDVMPWLVNLDYLRFPPRPEPDPEVEEEEIDLLENVDPTELPAVNFSTKELSVGANVLGAFAFELRPRTGGATISNFTMNAADAHISDLAETGGANIDWRFTNKMHTSSFNGLFAAGNLAQVLPAWGNDANVESTTARFGGNLQWSGSPLAFSLKKASGQLEMHITDGRFVDIEAGSAKIFGALNFDSLIRRLQLDFSDLFQSGFAFDSIDGNMIFNQGIVTTNEVIRIVGPSSNITINGEINLPLQTIAADMQVQIPLGQNISMLAGMLGAWPIALSTYIASKIFQEQMEDFTTIIYRLDGPWDAPEAGFEPPPDAQISPTPGLPATTTPPVGETRP